MSVEVHENKYLKSNTHILIVPDGFEYTDDWVDKTTEKVFYNIMYTFYRFLH